MADFEQILRINVKILLSFCLREHTLGTMILERVSTLRKVKERLMASVSNLGLEHQS